MAIVNSLKSHLRGIIQLCFPALLISFLVMSCNNNPNLPIAPGSPNPIASRDTSVNWITMDIKFKSGSNQFTRDSVIRSFQQILADTFAAMKSGPYPNLQSKISITYSPSGDPTHEPFQHYNIMASISDTLPKPCTCANNCKICLTYSFPNPSGNPTPPYMDSTTISH